MADRFIHISETPLDIQEITALASGSGNGAITTFIGTVRNATSGKEVHGLDFEAYAPMAIREMQKIAEEVKERWKIETVVIHHRIGSLGVGDIAVIIAVSAPHRKNTFAACQYCIDTLKETVPIWKKERFTDGEVWVSAHP